MNMDENEKPFILISKGMSARHDLDKLIDESIELLPPNMKDINPKDIPIRIFEYPHEQPLHYIEIGKRSKHNNRSYKNHRKNNKNRKAHRK